MIFYVVIQVMEASTPILKPTWLLKNGCFVLALYVKGVDRTAPSSSEIHLYCILLLWRLWMLDPMLTVLIGTN